MAGLKEYEVTEKGFVDLDMKPTKVGDKVLLPPRHGNTLAGLRFKQLKPTGRTAEQAAEASDEHHGDLSGATGAQGERGRTRFNNAVALAEYIRNLPNKESIAELGRLNGVTLDLSATRADLAAEAELELAPIATSVGLLGAS